MPELNDQPADTPPIVSPKLLFWPVLLGLVLDAIPAGLAWWMWNLPGWFPATVFVFCVIGGIAWMLAVIGALVGYGRVTAAHE